jgi:hypothetical protein
MRAFWWGKLMLVFTLICAAWFAYFEIMSLSIRGWRIYFSNVTRSINLLNILLMGILAVWYFMDRDSVVIPAFATMSAISSMCLWIRAL